MQVQMTTGGSEPTTHARAPRVALDCYVLQQGVKTGIYRVCAELFPLLARSARLRACLYHRDGGGGAAAVEAMGALLGVPSHQAPPGESFRGADILLSPFGVAPDEWLSDQKVLHAHIVHDLIGIRRPEYLTVEAADEVRRIMNSLDEDTVVFAVSEHTKADLLAFRPDLSPRQVTVIPLAAGTAFHPCTDLGQRASMRSRYGIPPEVPYVLSLATLEVRKNLDQVVHAFVAYLDREPNSDLHLVLSGMSGWKLERLEAALAAADRWRDRVVLTGFVEDAHLAALYSDALCFVYLSRYEGFGLPPLEAMACGTPVICANNSSLPEVVGHAGLLFDADDAQGVAEAFHRIATTPVLRDEFSRAGLERARLFSWERCAEIVTETLAAAHQRHMGRPSNRRRRALIPGEEFSRAKSVGGIAEASFLGYQNGSRGPCFVFSPLKVEADAGWPRWSDRLPHTESLVEGGLRILGRYKSGTNDNPLVSYITVVRNNTATLARTIESVQAQSYSNVEHIVLDGASTDGTLDLIRRYADRIDYFASEPDLGLYDAVNKAVPLARGQLICVLNSDDWLDPHAAEIAVHRLGGSDEAALLLTTAHVQVDDKLLEWAPAFVHPGCYFMCANDCHNGIYATRAAYEASGPYDTSYRIAADFKWIMASMEADSTFIYTREATVNYSLGGISSDGQQHAVECMRVAAERFPSLAPIEISDLYNAFFVFADVADLPSISKNPTDMVRDVFVRHGSDHGVVQALAWASLQKMEFPIKVNHPPPVPQFAGASVKEFVKAALRLKPTAYRLAQRLYAMARGR